MNDGCQMVIASDWWTEGAIESLKRQRSNSKQSFLQLQYIRVYSVHGSAWYVMVLVCVCVCVCVIDDIVYMQPSSRLSSCLVVYLVLRPLMWCSLVVCGTQWNCQEAA